MANDSKMMALLSVLSTLVIPLIVPLIFVFMKKDDDYVVFYSKQIIVLEIVSAVLMIVITVLGTILTVVTMGIGALIMLPLMMIVGLVALIMYVLCILNALSGEKKALPLIGGLWK
jgi:uncharacterized membrane protein